MKISQSKKLIMLSSLFAIGSFQACNCGTSDGAKDGVKRLEYYEVNKPPKTLAECFFGSVNKATGKVLTKVFITAFESVTVSPTRWFCNLSAAISQYAQFRNPTKILHHDDVIRLKDLMHQVLEHAQANDCDYDDYVVITKRVQECARYIVERLRLAQVEYIRARKGRRSITQRAVGLITSDYDVQSIMQMVEWMITDLEELYERSHYSKGFDIDHYKKVVCYLQADLNTLFAQLEEIV